MLKNLCLRLLGLNLLLVGCQSAPKPPQLAFKSVWSRSVKVAAHADSGVHAHGSNGVVYLNIENRGGVADRLLRAHAAACAVTELHQTIMQGDRMMMQPVTEGLEIPSHGELRLAPRGHHIMLMNLKRSLNVGDSLEVHLEFAHSGVKTVYSHVRE